MRKFFSFAMALLLSVTLANAETVRLYCKVTQGWWTADNAAVGFYAFGESGSNAEWPGVRMQAVEGQEGTWFIDVDPAAYTKLIFVRVNGSGDIQDWGAKTGDLTFPTDGKDLYTITSESAVWGDPGAAGEWSKYEAASGEGEGGGEAQPEEKVTVFFVNVPGWGTVKAYAWNSDGQNAEWPGVEMTKIAEQINEKDVYSITLDATYVNIVFNNGQGGADDKTGDLTIDAAKPYFYDGAWYAKADIPAAGGEPGEEEVKFYVTGDAALVGEALAWHPDAIAVKADSYTFEGLAVGEYKLKITVDGTWETGKGYSSLTVENDAFTKDDDDNIIFSLEEAGDVVVTYTGEVFKVEGKFKGGEAPEVEYLLFGSAASMGAWQGDGAAHFVDGVAEVTVPAGDCEFKVVTSDWNWDNALAFADVDAECSSKGISEGDNGNIKVTMKEEGKLRVEIKEGKLCVTGNFVAPEEPEVEYLLFGSAESMGAWQGDGAAKFVNGVAEVTVPAGDCEFKVVPTDWNWDNALAFADVDAECSSKGISEGDNGNIKVTMKEEGKLRVEIKEGKLCVTGNFVAPAEPEVDYFLVGSAEAIGAWGGEGAVKFVNGVATATLPAGVCEFKIVSEGESDWDWDHSLGFAAVDAECSSKGISEGENGNVKIEMAAEGELKVEIKNGKLCVTGNFVAPVEPVTGDGIFLVGTFNEWACVDAYKFAANPGAEGEFVLQTTLAENDQLKIKVVEGESETWYPSGDNYVVDAAHAGNVIIYFRPVENEDWADKNFFIQVQGGTGVENTAAEMKAQKFIENGQLFIIVNSRVFNAAGQVVR